MSLDEFNKSRQSDTIFEDGGSKSVATQTSPIIQPNRKSDTWRCNYFDLMDRIQSTLKDADELQQKKPSGIEEGVNKIWCKCFKCGEKNWYRTGPFTSVDYVSCDYCGGGMCDIMDSILEKHRVFTSRSQ